MLLWMVFKFMDSVFMYFDNKFYNFRVCFLRLLFFMGEWIVELMEFCNDSIGRLLDKEIFVYCFICEDIIIGEC